MEVEHSTRILHIDAPPPFLRFVAKYCQSRGIETDSTDSESLGFHYALVKHYRVILIGAHAPRIDAERILKGLLHAHVTTPVFLLTASLIKDEKLMGQHANLVGLISKPLDLKEFSRCIEHADKLPELAPVERKKNLSVLVKPKLP
ncbi:MAG TPA: hypothetical protein VK465_12900 [Fibrobacteria bacterium]|nr:hypothetical protein [Fibrobacteria bacterium]